MIVERNGETYFYDGTDWVIGSKVVVTDGDYRGLNGTLLSVRNGEDIDTDNDEPDFYCSLQPPALPNNVAEFEQRMSRLYGKPKQAEDIPLDEVILSPEELQPVKGKCPKLKLYIVEEEWAANDTAGVSHHIFTDFHLAMACMNDLIYREKNGGCISDWADDPNLIEESDATSYMCYVDGIYAEKHYEADVTPMDLELSAEVLKAVGEEYIDSLIGRSMYDSIAARTQPEILSERDILALANDSGNVRHIRKLLKKSPEVYRACSQIISEETFLQVQKKLREREQRGGLFEKGGVQ